MTHDLYLGLGANLGEREKTLRRALQLIGERVGRVARVSALRETEPWGFSSPRRFLNGACLVETGLAPRECLARTQQIERELGRKRKTSGGRYEDRAVDIDLLLYDDLRLAEEGLTLPHPLMRERPFVMEPLREVLREGAPLP